MTAAPDLRLVKHVFQQDLLIATTHIHKMAAFVFLIFWLHYWNVGENGDASSFFIYSLCYDLILNFNLKDRLAAYYFIFFIYIHYVFLLLIDRESHFNG